MFVKERILQEQKLSLLSHHDRHKRFGSVLSVVAFPKFSMKTCYYFDSQMNKICIYITKLRAKQASGFKGYHHYY